MRVNVFIGKSMWILINAACRFGENVLLNIHMVCKVLSKAHRLLVNGRIAINNMYKLKKSTYKQQINFKNKLEDK